MRYVSVSLAVLSVLLYAAGLVWFFAFSDKRRTTKRLLFLTIAIVTAILSYKTAEHIAAAEQLLPSGILIETMQSFSMDANYEHLLDPFPGTEGYLRTLTVWFKVLLYTSAPIAGGAVIYDILAGISPELRLLLLRRRKLLIFSELNEKTVTLAQSLADQDDGRRSFAVVFTDCYSDGEEESSELVLRAKNLRAVCLQADLLHCSGFRRSAHCSFYLMDEDAAGNLDDNSNLIALHGLLDLSGSVWNRKRGCSITMFTDSSETIENARALKKAFEKEEKALAEQRKKTNWKTPGKEQGDFRSSVQLHVIRDLATACCLHLNEEPLFQPLKAPGQPLDVVIFGNTPFSEEMFRSVFWCGQLLDRPLRISVVAPGAEGPEAASPFLVKLRRFNPELLESCTPKGDCLSIGIKDDSAPIYASLCFVSEDPAHAALRDFLSAKRVCQFGVTDPFSLKDADHFFVMSGSDEENVSLADELRRALIYLHNMGSCSGEKHVSVAVENADLTAVVTERFGAYCQQDKQSPWLGMHLFGCFTQRYSREIVTFDGADLISSDEGANGLRHELKDIGATSDDIYNEWSRIARAYHRKYMLHSAEQAARPGESKLEEAIRLRQELCWLEHRRWCAFLRAEGFSRPANLAEELKKERENYNLEELWQFAYKNVPSRLHPCLVECLREQSKDSPMDLLDMASRLREIADEIKKENESTIIDLNKYPQSAWPMVSSLKTYDYPTAAVGPSVSPEELQELWDELAKLFPSEHPSRGAEVLTAQAWLEAHPQLKETQPGNRQYCLILILIQLEKECKEGAKSRAKELEILHSQVNDLQEEQANLQKRHEALIVKHNSLKGTFEKLNAKNKKYKKLEEKNKQLDEQIEKFRDDQESLKEATGEAEEERRKLEAECEKLKKSRSRLIEKRGTIGGKCLEKETEVKDLEKSIQESQKQEETCADLRKAYRSKRWERGKLAIDRWRLQFIRHIHHGKKRQSESSAASEKKDGKEA